jgi:Ca2+-binding RTX toxin-like protein
MSALNTTISNGPSSNRVDIIFTGDGYQSSEIDTTYSSHVSALTNYMFSGDLISQPFGRYKNFFNAHKVNVMSNEFGADDPSTGTFRDTALDASYLWDGVTQRLLYVSDSKTDAAIASALSGTGIDPEMLFVTVNETQYGGGGGKYAVYAGGNQDSLDIALHEVGHSFAGLADEYGGSTTPYAGAEPTQSNVTTDPTGAKWEHWIGYDQPGIGTISAYEGGFYHESGIYRPSLDSKMRSLSQPFDAISREQFILRIYDYVDPIDAHTDNSGWLVNTDFVSVDVIDPAVIKVRWSVDGKMIQDGGVYALDLSNQGYGLGTFAVTALAYDDTDWVRTNRDKLQETVSWTVDVPTGATIGADNLAGTKEIDHISALAGNDSVRGFGGDDTLKGDAGKDNLSGGDGKDILNGGADKDTLTGGKDPDIFVFTNKPNKAGVDKITDYSVKDDSVYLDDAVFNKLGSGSEANPGKLDAAFFTISNKAKDANDYLIYNSKQGVLYYDADGAGRSKAVEVATLKKGLILTSDEFFMV